VNRLQRANILIYFYCFFICCFNCGRFMKAASYEYLFVYASRYTRRFSVSAVPSDKQRRVLPSGIQCRVCLSMALQPFVDLSRFFSFLFLYTVGRLLGRWISPSQGRYLLTEQHKHRTNAHTSMPRVGFEPTIPVFERAKTVHALDRAYNAVWYGESQLMFW
jgi:hypothetical protein